MRDYRKGTGPDHDRSFDHAPTRREDAHEATHGPARTSEDEVRDQLAAADHLAQSVAICIPKLEAAQPTENNRQSAHARRAVYDAARAGIDAQIVSVAETRKSTVAYAKRHQVDATSMLKEFDQKVEAAKVSLAAAPAAPARYQRVPGEDDIAAAITMPVGPERNAALMGLFAQLSPANKFVLKGRIEQQDREDQLALAFRVRVVAARVDLLGILDGTKRVRVDPRQVRQPPKAEVRGATGDHAQTRPDDVDKASDQALPIASMAAGRATAEAPATSSEPMSVPSMSAPSTATRTTPRGVPFLQLGDVPPEAVWRMHEAGVEQDAPEAAHDGTRALPYRAEMEQSFGRSLGHLQAYLGMASQLAPHGAQALATGGVVAFAGTQPSPALVAHEITHAVQNEQAGTATPMASGVVAARDSEAEAEADANAGQVAAHGPGVRLPPVTAAPAAHVQLAPAAQAAGGTPMDPGTEAYALRSALAARDGDRALEILVRHADREAMYALRRAYGDTFGADLRLRLTAEQFARARGIAGDQIALDVQIDGHDSGGIFRDLERITGAQALDLVISSARAIVIATETGPTAPLATLADVQAALRRHLPPNEYYRAMRLILEKAQRELVRDPQAVGMEVSGITASASDAHKPEVMAYAMKGKIAALRVDLAEERLRAADGRPGTKAEIDAHLAVADLDANQRKALALRLHDRPLHANPVQDLELAQVDDATVIKRAIVAAATRAAATRQAASGIGLDVALEHAGNLIRDARAKANDPKAPRSEREAAQKEVERLQRMFYDGPDGNVVIGTVSAASADADTYKDKLEALGVDQVAIGAELLAPIWVTSDVPGLIATLKKLPAEHRRAAMDRAGKLPDVQRLPPDTQKLVEAYLDVGAPVIPKGHEPAIVLDASQIGFVDPEVTIALADVLDGISHGPSAAHLVLARLQRLPYALRRSLFGQPRYRAAVTSMPRGEPKSEQRDFADALARAEVGDTGPDLAIANYPGPAGPFQQVALEHVRIVADKVGQATLRRGWILHERVKNDAAARAALEPMDRVALQHYEELDALKPLYDDPKQGEVTDDLAFGSVQLTDSSASAVDANTEATFMNLRLHKAVGLPDGTPLSSWAGSPAAIEALTEFETMYANERPGGVHRGALAQLAEIYYRALREVEQHKGKVAENEGLASIAATVAGVVVAVGVGVLSAGTAVPLLAAAALGGSAAGIASAAAGAAVRMHNTSGSVLRDLGAGFVEGVTSIASAGLAAKVVRGVTRGVDAGKAAASVGSHLVGQATGHSGAAAIAEAALDGAFSGAAGELFQTAVDEATWDRGAGEAIAKMLAAIARGGALGAGAGGVLGGLARLAKRAGQNTAENVGKLLDRASIGREAIDGMSEHAQDELARAVTLIESGKLPEAESVINGIAGITAKHREQLLAAARARSVFRTSAIDGIEIQGEFQLPEFVDDAKFGELAGNQNAHAVVLIRDGKPTIIARKGTPLAAIREEIVHVHQWESSLAMRARMQNLGEDKLARWHELAPQQKLAMHVDRLEVEADAQRQILRQLSSSENDPEAVIQVLDAEEALLLTSERLERLRAAKPPLDVAGLEIDTVPRIFSDTAHSAKPSGAGSRKTRKLIGEQAEDPKVQERLEALGYSIHHIEGDGKIVRIARRPDKPNLPHLSVEDGKIIPGKPRQSFAEIKADAAAEWGTKQRDLAELAGKLDRGKLGAAEAEQAQRELAQSGYRTVRVELRHLVEQGKIDAGTAGLVASWGQVLEELEARFHVDIKQLLARHLRSKSITDAQLSAFRGELREITTREILKLRGTRRAEILHEMIAIQPDSASKGRLFREYRRETMRAETAGGKPVYGVSDDASPESFHGDDLKNRRTPDDIVHIHDEAKHQLGPGRYAVEDKTGEHAFKIDQAEDYARRSYKAGKEGGGFTQTKGSKITVYDGLMYVFSTEAEARTAVRSMEDNAIINKVLGKEPGGIHVMFIDDFGKVKQVKRVKR